MLLPHEIVYQHKLDFVKCCKAQFGTHCEAHNEPTLTNMMVTCSTPAIVLGPTGNLQGTYKFFNTITGKKIKQQKLMAYPMPESIIKKVEQFGKSNAWPNTLLNFANRNGILFKRNDNNDEYPEGLIEDNVVLYLSLTAEISGVVLEQDLPIPTFEDKIKPQGCAQDTAARNTNLKLLDVAGVDAPTIIYTNNNKIGIINDDDNGILSITTIPANNNHNTLILHNTIDSYTPDNEIQYEDKGNNKDNLSNNDLDGQQANKPEEGLTDDQDQGVHRSKRNNKGTTAKYADYGLMMNVRQAKGGQSGATIRNGLMFFLEDGGYNHIRYGETQAPTSLHSQVRPPTISFEIGVWGHGWHIYGRDISNAEAQ